MPVSKKKFAVLSGAVLTTLSSGFVSAQVAGPYGPTAYKNATAGGYLGTGTGGVTAGGPNSIATGGTEVGNAYYLFTTTGQSSGNTQSAAKSQTGYILTSTGTINLHPAAGGTGPTSTAQADIANSINTNGTLISGISNSYNTTSGIAAVWKPDGTYVALPVSVTDAAGDKPNNTNTLINNAGTVVGAGAVYGSSGTVLSSGNPGGAFVWKNIGTPANPTYSTYSELLAPQNSTNSIATGTRSESAFGISDTGLAVGSGSLYNGTVSAGTTAVTWDTTSTPTMTQGVTQTTISATPLTLPTLSAGSSTTPFGTGTFTYSSGSGAGSGTVAAVTTTSQAFYVNASNVIAGNATIYNSSTANSSTGAYTAIGSEALLWNGPNSTGTFLPLSQNYITGNVAGVNKFGDAIGGMQGAVVANNMTPTTAVLWKYGTSSPTLLSAPTGNNPLTGQPYSSFTFVKGVNATDYSVGYVGTNSGDMTTDTSALLWDPSGVATDLNTLVPEVTAGNAAGTAGWVSLLQADAVSDDGWISGVGLYYDPGANYYFSGSLGTAGEYYRPFLLQDTAAVPEPASLAAVAMVAAVGTMRRRRKAVVSPV